MGDEKEQQEQNKRSEFIPQHLFSVLQEAPRIFSCLTLLLILTLEWVYHWSEEMLLRNEREETKTESKFDAYTLEIPRFCVTHRE